MPKLASITVTKANHTFFNELRKSAAVPLQHVTDKAGKAHTRSGSVKMLPIWQAAAEASDDPKVPVAETVRLVPKEGQRDADQEMHKV